MNYKYSIDDLKKGAELLGYIMAFRYAASSMLFLASLMLYGTIDSTVQGALLYLNYLISGIFFLGSLGIIFYPSYVSVIIQGLSCIIAGAIYSFTVLQYPGKTATVVSTLALFVGIAYIWFGSYELFSKKLREIFRIRSKKGLLAQVKTLKRATKKSRSDESDTIHCSSGYDKLKIKFIKDIACFYWPGNFVVIHRDNLSIDKRDDCGNFCNVSIFDDKKEILIAQFEPNDFKKYQAWKISLV